MLCTTLKTFVTLYTTEFYNSGILLGAAAVGISLVKTAASRGQHIELCRTGDSVCSMFVSLCFVLAQILLSEVRKVFLCKG